MRWVGLLFSALAVVSLVGCSYQPARISTVPAVIIDDGYYGHDRDRDYDRREKAREREEKRWEKQEKRWEKARKREEKRWKEERKHWEYD